MLDGATAGRRHGGTANQMGWAQALTRLQQKPSRAPRLILHIDRAPLRTHLPGYLHHRIAAAIHSVRVSEDECYAGILPHDGSRRYAAC